LHTAKVHQGKVKASQGTGNSGQNRGRDSVVKGSREMISTFFKPCYVSFLRFVVNMIRISPFKRTPFSYVMSVVADAENTGSASNRGRLRGNAVTT